MLSNYKRRANWHSLSRADVFVAPAVAPMFLYSDRRKCWHQSSALIDLCGRDLHSKG
jgi:hypothetical protein